MKNWLYNNKEIISLEDMDVKPYGFIYKITNKINRKFYIGKKQIMSITNVKLGKKELAELPITRGRKKTKKQVIKESNWHEYWGSNKILINDVKTLGEENFTKEILQFCYSSKQLTFFEIAYQIKNDVLFVDNCYNDNINGYYTKKDFTIFITNEII